MSEKINTFSETQTETLQTVEGPDVPPGYKRTEVGVIPEDWKIIPIGELFVVKAGGDFNPERSSATQDEKHPYPIYANGLDAEGLHGFCDYAEAQGGSITVTARGTLGVAFFRESAFTAIGRLLVLQPTSPLDGRYYAQYINTCVRFAIESTGVPQLTAPQIVRHLLPYPPLHEQHAIAEVLSDVDGLIEALDKLIAKKRAIKQAAMQQLLTGKIRLPGFSGEWEVRRLGNILQLQYGKSQKGIAEEGGEYPILATSGIVGKTNQYLYDKPSIIIGRKGTIDTPFYIDVPFWPIDTTFYAVISDKYSPKFIFYLLTTINWQSYNEASGVPSLSADTVHSIEVFIPARVEEQTAIATVLSDIDAEIEALERRREKVKQIKRGMMQELLTGRIRLVRPATEKEETPKEPKA